MVPKRLVHKGWRREEREEEERVREGEGVEVNRTDQEKSVVKETANLLEVRLPLATIIDVRLFLIFFPTGIDQDGTSTSD